MVWHKHCFRQVLFVLILCCLRQTPRILKQQDAATLDMCLHPQFSLSMSFLNLVLLVEESFK